MANIEFDEVFSSVAEAFEKHPDAYLAHSQIGDCMICGDRQDLRAGACFDCVEKVDGEPIKGGHRLWEKSYPKNTWYVGS